MTIQTFRFQTQETRHCNWKEKRKTLSTDFPFFPFRSFDLNRNFLFFFFGRKLFSFRRFESVQQCEANKFMCLDFFPYSPARYVQWRKKKKRMLYQVARKKFPLCFHSQAYFIWWENWALHGCWGKQRRINGWQPACEESTRGAPGLWDFMRRGKFRFREF